MGLFDAILEMSDEEINIAIDQYLADLKGEDIQTLFRDEATKNLSKLLQARDDFVHRRSRYAELMIKHPSNNVLLDHAQKVQDEARTKALEYARRSKEYEKKWPGLRRELSSPMASSSTSSGSSSAQTCGEDPKPYKDPSAIDSQDNICQSNRVKDEGDEKKKKTGFWKGFRSG